MRKDIVKKSAIAKNSKIAPEIKVDQTDPILFTKKYINIYFYTE